MKAVTEFRGVDVGLMDDTVHKLEMDNAGNIYLDGHVVMLHELKLKFGKYFIEDELDYLQLQLELEGV